MGVSSKKTTTKSTPYDPAAIKAGSDALTNTYNANSGKVQGAADNILGLQDEMLAKYRAGNPAVNAANGYVTDTLGSDGTNPNLDAWIADQQGQTQNALGARLNKLGIGPAGSSYQGLAARENSRVGLGLKYDDWNNGQQRKAQAAGMAPGLAAADTIQIAPLLAATELGANLPMQNAAQYASGIGGLLSPYGTQTQKQSGGMLGALLGAGLSGWASGGFRGI